MGRYRSSQTDQTVNLVLHGFVGANPTRPKLLCFYLCYNTKDGKFKDKIKFF